MPDLFQAPDQMTRSERYWIQWNEAIEKSAHRLSLNYLRYRVEDLDLALLNRINKLVGSPASRSAIEDALGTVSRKTNTRTRNQAVSWETFSTLPKGLSRRLNSLAKRYGYAVP